MSIFHLKDIMTNQRLPIKSSDVQHASIPMFEGLYLNDLLQFARDWNNGYILQALPVVEKEVKKLPREYVTNVIQTLAKDDFSEWVKRRVEARNRKLVEDREMTIQLDQTILDIFNASNAVSGKFYFPKMVTHA